MLEMSMGETNGIDTKLKNGWNCMHIGYPVIVRLEGEGSVE